MKAITLFLSCSLLIIVANQVEGADRSFTIGFDQNVFLKDGEPFRFISGSMHYFRVPHQYWEDRLLKMRAAGLNAVQTYVEWSSHETEPNEYNFEGNLDLVQFVLTAQKVGLYVIIRPGPYIDAERDMGGLPYWLLSTKKNIALRTMDSDYLKAVDKWFSKLLPMLKPLLYINGGPILSVQVENEYGSYYACDRDYVAFVAHKIRCVLGIDVLLFTTDGDGDSYLNCGPTLDAYPTVDFGAGVIVSSAFAILRHRAPAGPLVNSEYYPGWLDHWGQPHAHVDSKIVAQTLDEMLAINASVNIYMFHGGTSFGFGAGSNFDGINFDVCPTSYDYDAPISEAGDLTEKYDALKNVIAKYAEIPDIKVKKTGKKIKFGPVYLQPVETDILTTLKSLSTPVNLVETKTFEELMHGYGFVLYETTITQKLPDPVLLTITGIRDRGYIYVDGQLKGVLSRQNKIYSLPISVIPKQTLSILVENQGRICYGTFINDTKGIEGPVKLGNTALKNWTMYAPKLEKLVTTSDLRVTEKCGVSQGVFKAVFNLPNNTEPADTFLRLDGWVKGVAFINGFNLGRYWPNVGPQVTLYVPGVLLKPQNNTLILLELQTSPCKYSPKGGCFVRFQDTPIINGPTPQLSSKPRGPPPPPTINLDTPSPRQSRDRDTPTVNQDTPTARQSSYQVTKKLIKYI